MKLFRRDSKPNTAPPAPVEPATPDREPNTHDYRPGHLMWGHNIVIHRETDEGLRASGWGYGIERGDHLLVRHEGSDVRCEITELQYHPDPRDMWAATLIRLDQPA